MFKPLIKALLSIFIVGFFSSCLVTERGDDGLYTYDYCIGVGGVKSVIILKNDSFSTNEKVIISGRVLELKSQEPIYGAIATLIAEPSSKTVTQTSDITGDFSFEVPRGKYKLTIYFIGCSAFESNITADNDSYFEIGLGRAGGFASFIIKSDRKLTNRQLHRKALKLSRQY